VARLSAICPRADGAVKLRTSCPPYPNGRNGHNCPLYHQTGEEAVYGFASLIARMSPEDRAAFERERLALQAELGSELREA